MWIRLLSEVREEIRPTCTSLVFTSLLINPPEPYSQISNYRETMVLFVNDITCEILFSHKIGGRPANRLATMIPNRRIHFEPDTVSEGILSSSSSDDRSYSGTPRSDHRSRDRNLCHGQISPANKELVVTYHQHSLKGTVAFSQTMKLNFRENQELLR